MRIIKRTVIAFILLILVAPASAEEIQYLEFTSRFSSEYIEVAEVNLPSQQFIPFNDTISGVDLWVDNNGGAGYATVELRRLNDNALLASKTVSIPAIPDIWGGEKFHVAFNSPVQVTSNGVYKINVLSSMPSLHLYYSDIVDIQQHNSSYLSDASVLQAYLGSVEQGFAFKFALYESDDNLQPVLSNVTANPISSSETLISFNSNEPVDYRVLLAPNGVTPADGTAFRGFYSRCNKEIGDCTAIVGTEPDTGYDYKLIVRDEWGNEGESTGSFTSLDEASEGGGDTAEEDEAVISITSANISSLSSKSATIFWNTNVLANSSMVISILDDDGIRAVTSVGSGSYTIEHLLTTGPVLQPERKYFAEIISFDSAGNSDRHNIEFTTPMVPTDDTSATSTESEPSGTATTTEPSEYASQSELTGVTVDVSVSGDGSSASIRWDTPEGGAPLDGYRIDIFDSENNLRLSILTDTEDVVVSGLEPGDYHAVVYANNGGVFDRLGDPIPFSIPGLTKTISYRTRVYSIIIISIILLALSLAFMDVRRKSREKRKKSGTKDKEAGLTLLEVIISVSLLVAVIAVIGFLGRDVINLGVGYTQRFATSQDIEITINEMITEIRSVSQSHEGSYPIAVASSSTLAFYTDKKGDGSVEKVRYFLDGDTLRKGIIVPSGDPLEYDPSDEVFRDVVRNMELGTSSIFSYYGEDFTGEESPLSLPVTISDIRMIEVNLSAKDISQITPVSFSVRITPRNLRSNI